MSGGPTRRGWRRLPRFFELLGLTAPDATLASGTLEARGQVPEPFEIGVDLRRVNTLLGTALGASDLAELLEPLGFACAPRGDEVVVTVPTNRPDVRPAPQGVADIVEEVARAYGYSRLARRQPAWPEPGGLNAHQRERRRVRAALVGLGAAEAVTQSLVGATDHVRFGYPAAVEVANPLATDEGFLRRSLLPGLLRALAWNADRRQGDIRLFEVGTVFIHPSEGTARVVERSGAGGTHRAELPAEREMAGALFAASDDDARTAVAACSVVHDALRLNTLRVTAPAEHRPVPPGLHPTRSAWLVVPGADTVVGAVGEVDPDVAVDFGLDRRRIGWLELDLGLLLDPTAVARRPDTVQPVSRFPSSDVDLAFTVPDEIPADRIGEALRDAGGELLESVDLFDVYRGPSVGPGRRSLAFRLRFSAFDRTLTDAEVGVLREACIAAAAAAGALLR